MADFPGKVSTETSSPQARTAARQQNSISMDLNLIRSIPGILLLVEIVLGLLVWAITSTITYYSGNGWVMFVSVTLWILTVVLFIILFLGLQKKMTFVPWGLALLVFYGVATFLYLTAFLTSAITAGHARFYQGYNNLIAAAVFGILVTLAYGVSTFFTYMEWKSDGGNAAASTVPV